MKHSYFFFLLVIIFLFPACKKQEPVNDMLLNNIVETGEKSKLTENAAENFYKTSNVPKEVIRIINKMKADMNMEELNNFIQWYGQPSWEMVIKFNPDKNGSITYAIPTWKNKELTGFFAATITDDKIGFEMHRKSAMLSQKKEYSYANINEVKSKAIFNYFNNSSVQNAKENTTNSLWDCAWTWVQVNLQSAGNHPQTGIQNMVGDPYGYWLIVCFDMGNPGGGGGNPGNGGGGSPGGGGTNCELNQESLINTVMDTRNWWNNQPSSLSACELINIVNQIDVCLFLGSNASLLQWLIAHENRAMEIEVYIGASCNDPQKSQIAKDHLLRMIADPQYLNFVINHAQLEDPTKMWWEDAVFLAPYGGINFGDWAINYVLQHPAVSIPVFQNQFMNIAQNPDGAYDAAYWDDPNLSFPPQSLPTWLNFKNVFPLDTDPLYDTPEKMYNSIGGAVATLYTGPNTNTCAIRLSKALNYSGVIIPNIPGQTFKGADDKYYFKAAYQINLWMRKTFGTNPATATTPFNENHYHYTGIQAGANGINLPGLLNGKQGIYSLYSSNFSWASGHADLLNPDATCGNACHFYDAPIAYIDIWVLN